MTFVRSIDANIPFRAIVVRAYYSPPPPAHPSYSPSLILGTSGKGPGGTWHSLLPGSPEWNDTSHDALNVPEAQIQILIAAGVLHDDGQTADGNIKLKVPRPFWVKVLKENTEGGKTKINVQVLGGPTIAGPEGSEAPAPQNAPTVDAPASLPGSRDVWREVKSDAEKAIAIAKQLGDNSLAPAILLAKVLRVNK